MKAYIPLAALILVLILPAARAGAATGPAPTGKGTPPAQPAPGKIIPGQYIVVLKPGSSPATTAATTARLATRPQQVYSHALQGFAASLTDQEVARLRKDPQVLSIEPDQMMHTDASGSPAAAPATWGLDRINQRALPLDGQYSTARTGAGVRAYIIDTGIQTGHPDFGGRATNVYDAFGGNGQDCNGHGTHVAGTIGGQTYGVAKGVALRGVRVLDCSGSGATSGILAAIDWVRQNAVHPAVANLSLGGGYSPALNTAVTNLVNSGVFVAVAAGNESQNACNVSPASAPGTYTVAASDRADTRASFSNYGSCVDSYAPGVNITSDWLNGGTNTISGTSMATPHVAGAAALYKATYGDAAAATIARWLATNATQGVIRSNAGTTPNRLLYRP
jgi:subtilisin family serine protease